MFTLTCGCTMLLPISNITTSFQNFFKFRNFFYNEAIYIYIKSQYYFCEMTNYMKQKRQRNFKGLPRMAKWHINNMEKLIPKVLSLVTFLNKR